MDSYFFVGLQRYLSAFGLLLRFAWCEYSAFLRNMREIDHGPKIVRVLQITLNLKRNVSSGKEELKSGDGWGVCSPCR